MTTSWIGAKQVASQILSAIVDASPGPEVNATTKPLDERTVPALIRGADFFMQFPETAASASRIREIALRYAGGRPDAGQWKSDYEFASRLDGEVMRWLIEQ
jgi:hypothetical protein